MLYKLGPTEHPKVLISDKFSISKPQFPFDWKGPNFQDPTRVAQVPCST